MPRATWNGALIAQADDDAVERVEGNIYFPPGAVDKRFLRDSQTHTVCSWKGTASYYDLTVEGNVNQDAAWYYPSPKSAAMNIAGYVAFWKGVVIEE